jgi:hypothetical protein
MPLANRLPLSRVPDPAEAPPLRWGVIGTGWIAERFVDAIQSQTRHRVVAWAPALTQRRLHSPDASASRGRTARTRPSSGSPRLTSSTSPPPSQSPAARTARA